MSEQNQDYQIRALFQPKSLNDKERTVEVVLSTEKPVEVWDSWRWEIIDEVLLASGAEFEEQIPLLNNHNRQNVRDVIGSVRHIQVNGEELRGRAFFAETEESDRAYKLVRDGHLTDLSIGYRVLGSTIAEAGETIQVNGKSYTARQNKLLRVATKYKVFEGSLTPVGANDEAKVRSQQKSEQQEVNSMAEDGKKLDQSAKSQASSDPGDSPDALGGGAEPEKTGGTGAIKAAIANEQKRASEIVTLCRQYEIEPETYIDRGFSVQQVKADILDQLAIRRQPQQAAGSAPEPGQDAVDKTRAFLDNCLALRMDLPLPNEKTEAARLSLVDMAREYLAAHKISGVRHMSKAEIAKLAFSHREAFSHGTGDFPYILANALNKRLAKSYLETPSTYQIWCYETTTSDFKQVAVNSLGEGAELSLVPPGGPFPEETMTEGREVYSLGTYGKIFAITRQALVNDDLRAFDKIARRQGYMAKYLVNKLAYTVLTANAALSDSVALFHATHANLGTAALSSAALSAGRAAMRIQKGPDGNAILNLIGKYLLVPAALEVTALQLVKSQVVPEATYGHAKNIHEGQYDVVVEGLLDANSTTAWYIGADNRQWDTVEVCFLEGYKEPVLEQQDGFEVDGRKYKVRHDVVAKAICYRGLYKSSGAG